MAKLLNLDSIIAKAQSRELVLNGVTHKVLPMDVENFIATTRSAQRNAEATIDVQVEEAIAMIVRSIPSLDASVLGKLPLEQLKVVIAWVRGDDVQEVSELTEGEAGKA